MSTEKVIIDIEDGIATITLNDPDRMNALSDEIHRGIMGALDEIERHDDARCVVFTGAGHAFSAGGDIDRMRERIESEEGVVPNDFANALKKRANVRTRRIMDFDLPTIAKVDGVAVGAGVSLALSCDIQIVSERAKFGLAFRNVGLVPDAGLSYVLPRLVGTNTAKELALTGEIIDATDAKEFGLISRVYAVEAFEAAAADRIKTIANGPTTVLEYTADLLDRGFDSTLDEALENEAVTQGVVGCTDDHEEGVRAFLEDRPPEFTGN